MRGKTHNRCAIEVAATLPPESVRLVYCDGPYGLGFGEWDKAQGPGLVDWYAPHFDAWERILQPSCSLVVWGFTRSWAWLHCELIRRGWEQCGQVVWDKSTSWALRSDKDVLRSWVQTHEIVGIYRRDGLAPPTGPATTVQYAAGADERNWIRVWLGDEWKAAGLRRSQANEAMGTNSMAGHYFDRSQWALPTWEAYQTLAAYAAEHGKPLPRERNGRPWLHHPDAPPLRATFEHLRAEFEHLRAEFEHLRAPFNLERVLPSVWREATPTAKGNRHGHPCQKPDTLTRTLIEVLTRPGETVFEPFGGSMPVARICEALPDDKARRYVSCEVDAEHYARSVAMMRRVQGALF